MFPCVQLYEEFGRPSSVSLLKNPVLEPIDLCQEQPAIYVNTETVDTQLQKQDFEDS